MSTWPERARSGAAFEQRFGYSRAVRAGGRVIVSGTAPVWPDGSCDPDPRIQARRCFEIAFTALRKLGASPAEVIRTRIFIVERGDAEAVGLAHAEALGAAAPAATMVIVAGLLDPRWRVEIELEALARG